VGIIRGGSVRVFEKGWVWVKRDSFEERTIALMVARCLPWDMSTGDRRNVGLGTVPWGKEPKQRSRLGGKVLVT